MANRTIKHEVKLQKSVIVILGILAIGVFANAFAPAFSVKDAMAEFAGGSAWTNNLSIDLRCTGC